MTAAELETTIDEAWEQRDSISPDTGGKVRDAIENALNALDTLEGDVEEIPAEGSLAPDSYEIAPGTQVGAVLTCARRGQVRVVDGHQVAERVRGALLVGRP